MKISSWFLSLRWRRSRAEPGQMWLIRQLLSRGSWSETEDDSFGMLTFDLLLLLRSGEGLTSRCSGEKRWPCFIKAAVLHVEIWICMSAFTQHAEWQSILALSLGCTQHMFQNKRSPKLHSVSKKKKGKSQYVHFLFYTFKITLIWPDWV